MAEQGYYVPAGRTRTEFIERKSRFITTISIVESVEEAEAFLAEIKAEFPDATHNCAAYRIKTPLVERFFDDGEPGGTAGMPMLDVLKKQELFDVTVVVTRYFGGILLGAGGLVRAYSKGAADGVAAVGTARMEPGVRLLLRCGYPIYDRVQRMPALQRAEILNTEFGAEIEMELMLRTAEEEALRQALADLSAGTAVLERLEEIFYPFKTIC
ncbi:MAG: YigZ family protein [Clostridia bacterium]|nr:YigZ family protein [Clostridia bacterium]